MQESCPPVARAAILSFHSHGDRSFLDDRELAVLSGVLRTQGIANDLVVSVFRREDDDPSGGSEIEGRLVETLRAYSPIVYERVWSQELIARLKQKLPDHIFIGCRGEHVLEDAPADIICEGDLKDNLPRLIQWVRGEARTPPVETLHRKPEGGWTKPALFCQPPKLQHPYAPNLQPVVVNPELLPAGRTFSIKGNEGCPFQNDARENPVYAGVKIPIQFGRGCAFCTTGNNYDGRPNTITAAWVMQQIRYVREHAPQLELLVLKDQNPFGYLTEVVTQCAEEQVKSFTLMLETRGDWFLRNAKRFERALEVAQSVGIRLAPFLVGVENFSQPELDRFNKGTTAEANIEFLETLWRWKETYGEAMDLSHASFGFILFSPWTTLADLKVNLAAIRRTRFDRFRGSILLSRARLYPDTALFYLAQKDGLLAEEFLSESENNSRRYGYYPSQPWRFLNADVEHFAALGTQLAEKNGGRDMVNLFECLLDAFARVADYRAIDVNEVLEIYKNQQAQRSNHGQSNQGQSSDGTPGQRATSNPELRQRFARLVQPLSIEETFAAGWRFADLSASPGRLRVELKHDVEVPVIVELVPRNANRGTAPIVIANRAFERSRHYDIRYENPEISPSQREALTLLCQAIARNDP